MTVTAFEGDVDDNGDHDNLVHRAQWKAARMVAP